MRTTLGLTDLNRFVEDFFKELLNEALDLKLVNANEERSNAPGLDLIDAVARVGYQVTSQKTSQKVNDTLETVVGLEDRPDSIRVFVVGKKQHQYTLNAELCEVLGFGEHDIWDITDLGKVLVGLPIDSLQKIHNQVSNELAHVKIELEIPDAEGNYPTTILDYVEPIPVARLGDLNRLRDYLIEEEEAWADDFPQFEADVREFADKLAKLPRITRDFYCFLLERKDDGEPDEHGHYTFDYNRLKRICRYPEMDGEIDLLEKAGLIWFNEGDYDETASVTIRGQGDVGYVVVELIGFMAARGIPFRTAMVSLDFSAFGTDA